MNQNYCENNLGRSGSKKRCFFVAVAMTLLAPMCFLTSCASATATQSTLSISTTDDVLSLNIMPSIGGTFAKSSNNTVLVNTNNFTGYLLTIASEGSTSLTNDNDDEIETLAGPISQTTFVGSRDYVNQWGYMPSQYIVTSGGVDTVVENTDFLPAPSSGGDTLALTSSPNSSSDEYTIAFGAKVDYSLPAGAYEYTYLMTAVPNSIVQTITYDANTTETVSNMPTPNPQVVTIDGGTPVEESFATLSSNTPIMNGKYFNGWCDEPTTTSGTGNQVCNGTTYAAGSQYGIDQTTDANNITLYAIWVDTLFPVVWNQMGACEFHGNTPSNITGSECEDYWDSMFIDTGVALYSQANASKDYEIHFTIDEYNPSIQTGNDEQQTFVSDKLSTSASSSTVATKSAPGLVVRRSGTSIEFNSKIDDNQVRPTVPTTTIMSGGGDVSIFRLDGKIYYSINNDPLVLVQDVSGFNQFFGLTAWFGGYPSDGCTGDTAPCTNAKRFVEATLSNMYIKLGEYSEHDILTITFDANGGTPATTSRLIRNGNAITTLPAEPTYTDHLFQGWFTGQTDGTEITAATVPTESTTYYAHWLASVAIANITNSSITLQPGATETINVTNSAELESYSFTSSNTGVATVDPTTGEVTAVAPGVTTITMTGALSGATKTIDVTVSGVIYTVSFDSQGGTAVSDVQVGDGASIDPLPTSTKSNYQLEGWYTGTNGTGTQLTTSTVFDENTPRQYYANWTTVDYVCKVATVQHEEPCNRTNSGCVAAGYARNDPIYYGSLITTSGATPVAGNAFTCDINGDIDFDEADERFYFIGMNGNNAKLLYYKSISNEELPYADGLSVLPSTGATGWTNPKLTTFSSTDYGGSYDGKVARFMERDEAVSVCDNSTTNFGTNGKCLYILEASNFANSNIRDGYWLGGTNNSRVHTSTRKITDGSGKNGVRPVIEVPMEYISLDVPVSDYVLTFDPHNDTISFTVEIAPGEAIGADMPADPTYTDHIFQGWFTDETGGTRVTSATEPTGDVTYHAQWLKTVALAELASSSVSVEPNGTATIHVTNSAELESYTFTSNDTDIATVDSSTGVVTGVANGTTTITMTGTTSGATKTINVTVSNLLPVTQAIIANEDLTLSAGGQITVLVSNSSEIEPYTFGSEDTSIATVDANTGVITGVSAGTTNIIMTGANSGLTKTLEVDVTAAPVVVHTVTFNANGGSSVESIQVEDGNAVGDLPTSTRANHKFFGWYTDDGTFYDEVNPGTIVESDVTYYAKWIEDTTSFPIVFSEINECDFNGKNAVMSGDYCTQDKTKKYIDTGVALFSSANYDKDFEIGFTLLELGTQTDNQATLVNSKRENSATNYPGFVMRNASGTTNYELTGRFSNGSPTAVTTNNTTPKTIKIVRQDGVLKYSFDGGALTTWFDASGNTHRFDTRVWFGAGVTSNDTGAQRFLIGKMTDMYVKLGEPTEYIIDFDANGGTVSEASRTITIGDPVGTLPTPTPPNENYVFDAWYDESVTPAVAISTSTIPDGNKTYIAHYHYNSSDTPVEFNIANDALRGYQATINDWVQSPINITTFNEASTINDSTWGDTTELSEREYWIGMKSNFETNGCMIPSYSDAAKPTMTPALTDWANGSVDCSKPKAYDTKIGAALNVYLDNNQGEQVSYADADDGIIHNMIPGQTYYWEKADDSTVYGYVTATSVNGRRFTDTGIIRNTRDLGGLPMDTNNDGAADSTVAYGRLFRGEKLWNAPTSELTKLGINKEYDVGNPAEYSGNTKLPDYKNDQVIHYNFDYNSGDEANSTSNYMRAWTAVTDIMTDIADNNKNIYFHCRVGADRTGTVAYLLEGLLGVPDEARYEEYSLTHLSGLYDRTRYYKQKSSSNNLKFVYMMGYVSTTQDIYNWYMKNPNADATLIQRFRTAMAE